jgi:DNA-binding NtrC family response regulator
MGSAARSLPERVVLVVDDEELVCRMTSRMLADAGFRVLWAHRGDAALALLASMDGAVHLVVSDIAMPGMTGLELAAVIADRWPTLPVLLISGYGGPPSGSPFAFLPKPFTCDVLLNAVAKVGVAVPKHAASVTADQSLHL